MLLALWSTMQSLRNVILLRCQALAIGCPEIEEEWFNRFVSPKQDEQQTVAEHLLRFCDRVQFGGHMLVTVPEHRFSRESKATQLAWRGKQYIIVHS